MQGQQINWTLDGRTILPDAPFYFTTKYNHSKAKTTSVAISIHVNSRYLNVRLGPQNMSYQFIKVLCPRLASGKYCEAKNVCGQVIRKIMNNWDNKKFAKMRRIDVKHRSVPEYRHKLLEARPLIAEAVPVNNYLLFGLTKK